jgi:hypothetical protein
VLYQSLLKCGQILVYNAGRDSSFNCRVVPHQGTGTVYISPDSAFVATGGTVNFTGFALPGIIFQEPPRLITVLIFQLQLISVLMPAAVAPLIPLTMLM